MAAGAIPPPLFFEQRRFRKHFWPPTMASSRTALRNTTLENTTSVDHAI